MAIILLDHQLSVRHWTSLPARHLIMSHAMDNSSFWHCSQTLKPTSTVNVKVHYLCTLYIVKVHVHLYINCTKQEWLFVFLTLPNSWYLYVSQYNGLHYSLHMKKLHWNRLFNILNKTICGDNSQITFQSQRMEHQNHIF